MKSTESRATQLHRLLWLGLAAILCLASFYALFLISTRYLVTTYLLQYWRAGFMPMPPWKDVTWMPTAWYVLLQRLLGLVFVESTRTIANYALAILATSLFMWGCISSLSKRWQLSLAIILPFILVLLASALQRYPFADRLMLFSIPILVMPIAEGTERARFALMKSGARRAVYLVVIAFLVFKPIAVSWQRFYRPVIKTHFRPAIAYMSSHRLSLDTIYFGYLHNDDIPAFDYYASAYGLRHVVYKREGDHIKDTASREAVSYDIGHLRSAHICVVFSRNCEFCKIEEETSILQDLDKVGSRLDSFKSEDVSAYLYNLSGS